MTTGIAHGLQAITLYSGPNSHEAREYTEALKKAHACRAEYLSHPDDFFTGARAMSYIAEACINAHSHLSGGDSLIEGMQLPEFFAPFRAIMTQCVFVPGAEATTTAAAHAPNIRKLWLDPSTNYTIELATQIGAFLKTSQSIEEVSLCAPMIGAVRRLNDETLAPIAKALEHNQSIRSLRLNDTAITDAAILQIIEALMRSPNCVIERIDLAGTLMTPAVVPALIRLIQTKTTLNHIGIDFLSANPALPQETRQLIYDALEKNKVLQENMRQEAFQAHLSALKPTNIQEIEEFIRGTQKY